MAIKINTALQNALLDRTLRDPSAITTGIFDGATLEIRDGAQPADANQVATGTLLASMMLATPAFNVASNGTAAIPAQIQDAAANAAGTATWCRIKNVGDTIRIDGDVGATASGAFLELSTTTIVLNGVVTVTALSLTHPA